WRYAMCAFRPASWRGDGKRERRFDGTVPNGAEGRRAHRREQARFQDFTALEIVPPASAGCPGAGPAAEWVISLARRERGRAGFLVAPRGPALWKTRLLPGPASPDQALGEQNGVARTRARRLAQVEEQRQPERHPDRQVRGDGRRQMLHAGAPPLDRNERPEHEGRHDDVPDEEAADAISEHLLEERMEAKAVFPEE